MPGLLARARQAGVGLLLNVGLDLETSRRGAELARRYRGGRAGGRGATASHDAAGSPRVLAAAGVHPRWLHRVEPAAALAELEALVRAGQAAAIGEVGLEYAAEAASPEAQRAFFADCLELARRLGVGVSLHVVGAHDDALHLLAERGPARAVVHYFQGGAELAGRYLEAGCWISVGKPVAREENAALREAVRTIPLDRLLLETDSYPLPGRTTEPRHVAEVCRAVAELRGQAVEAVAEATTSNLRRLLGLGR